MPHGKLELHKARTFEATPERIFEALSRPTELARWWGPHGFTVPSLQLDLRVGGRYRLQMKPPHGEPFHLEGEFREVQRPVRLSYTFNWDPPDVDDRQTLVTLTLHERDGGTELRLDHGEFATEARRALHDAGWNDSLDRLGDLLSQGGGPGAGRGPVDPG